MQRSLVGRRGSRNIIMVIARGTILVFAPFLLRPFGIPEGLSWLLFMRYLSSLDPRRRLVLSLPRDCNQTAERGIDLKSF